MSIEHGSVIIQQTARGWILKTNGVVFDSADSQEEAVAAADMTNAAMSIEKASGGRWSASHIESALRARQAGRANEFDQLILEEYDDAVYQRWLSARQRRNTLIVAVWLIVFVVVIYPQAHHFLGYYSV